MSEKTSKKKISKSDLSVINWLIGICKSQIGKIAVIIFTNTVGAAASIFYANFSKHIIDGAVVYHDKNYVIRYAVYLLLLIMGQLVLNLVGNSFIERSKGRMEMILKKHMLSEIMRKDYSKVSAYHTGELQNRMFNDVAIIADGLTTILPSFVFFMVKLVCAFAYLVVIDKIFALVFFVGGILVFFSVRVFRGTLKKLHKEVQRTEGVTRSFIQETIINLLVVKSFVVEDKIEDKTDELQDKNYKVKMKRRHFNIIANGGISATFNLGYVFALAFGAFRLLSGGMTYGTVTAMLQLVNQVQAPFASLSGILPKIYSLVASGERLMEICNLPDEEESNKSDVDTIETYDKLQSISFKDISFKYDRDIILDNTSLNIKKGDFVAIMGISGIGKSTLLKLLLGVFSVNGGSISLKLSDGEITVDRHTRKLFAYVPQGNMLLSGTIRDNLTFINSGATDEEIEKAIKISCAKQFIDELPLGLETVIGEKGMGLSEGQIQRLAIARSLLSKSPVLLLDEATSALDEETEKQFLMNLKQLENKTCIIVSHKKAALEICNKYVQIVDSKIICEEK